MVLFVRRQVYALDGTYSPDGIALDLLSRSENECVAVIPSTSNSPTPVPQPTLSPFRSTQETSTTMRKRVWMFEVAVCPHPHLASGIDAWDSQISHSVDRIVLDDRLSNPIENDRNFEYQDSFSSGTAKTFLSTTSMCTATYARFLASLSPPVR